MVTLLVFIMATLLGEKGPFGDNVFTNPVS